MYQASLHCVTLQVMNEDDLTSSIRDKILTITVKKGWKEGTRITFQQEGDQGPNNIPGTCLSLFNLWGMPALQATCSVNVLFMIICF